MKIVDLGWDYFDDSSDLELCITVLNPEGGTLRLKLSDVLEKAVQDAVDAKTK